MSNFFPLLWITYLRTTKLLYHIHLYKGGHKLVTIDSANLSFNKDIYITSDLDLQCQHVFLVDNFKVRLKYISIIELKSPGRITNLRSRVKDDVFVFFR